MHCADYDECKAFFLRSIDQMEQYSQENNQVPYSASFFDLFLGFQWRNAFRWKLDPAERTGGLEIFEQFEIR